MRVVIVEDEKPAAEKLIDELQRITGNIELVKVIHDVRSAVAWFNLGVEIDLIFMDIELTDGLSFEILKSVQISVPIIFITAHDQYWQKALSLNGIDYLLKPTEFSDLKNAISKYQMISQHFSEKMDALIRYVEGSQKSTFKEKFLLRRGKELVMVTSGEIVFFKSSHKVTMLITNDRKKLIVEQSLVQLEQELDPSNFLRANRQYIININFIEKILVLSKGKMKVMMKNEPDEIVIAQEKASKFKQWLA